MTRQSEAAAEQRGRAAVPDDREEAAAPAAGARNEEAVSRFVERFASQLVEAGMPRMPSRVFAALLASDSGALTSAELGEQLRISPAAVSGAVRYLAQQHMVSREREPGSRRDRYRVHSNQWYEAMANRDSILRRWEDALREGVASLGPDSAAGRRLAETLAFFDFVQNELADMMERWRVHREKVFGPG
ncbi:MarR family transcriptional regulator [Streptomyces sp. PSKA54]|uniref:MarR family transcriptional regulator n=1 Tax=Streptomyces himalayensis subsp. aureolus TaxID=2758039 RepID=A0A7W2HK02_9ACTN|nr:MarR family transcriptional regulator [Streptomyces himalayensis]MBA4866656.1 MarR family transcriptional regulator [Streptomyces himalayensis subsp. aureolus]